MSAVNLSAIRSRFADKVSSLDGFHESRNPFDGYGRSPNTVSHKLFSIGVGRVESRDDDRQRRGVGVMSQSEILVWFIYRVRFKD